MGERSRPIRAVLFDLFDTLVDLHMEAIPREDFRGRTIPASARKLFEALERRGEPAEMSFEDFAEALVEVDQELLRSRYAQGLEAPTLERFALLADRLRLPEEEVAAELTAIHMGGLRDLSAVPAHHASLLRRLAESFRVGLCSNFSHTETALGILEEAQMLETLHAISVSEEVGIRKPRPEIFEAVLDKLGVSAEETLHVGDNLHADVSGASALGLRTVWITRRVADPEAARRAYAGPAPDHCIHDLAELFPLLGLDLPPGEANASP